MAKGPLWQVEDALTAAKQAAQQKDSPEQREVVRQHIEEAIELLEG